MCYNIYTGNWSTFSLCKLFAMYYLALWEVSPLHVIQQDIREDVYLQINSVLSKSVHVVSGTSNNLASSWCWKNMYVSIRSAPWVYMDHLKQLMSIDSYWYCWLASEILLTDRGSIAVQRFILHILVGFKVLFPFYLCYVIY